MSSFFRSLTPDQITLLAGVLVSLIHSSLVKGVLLRVKSFSDVHKAAINWITSFVLPVGAVIALALHNSSQFNHAFPVYAEVYATAQLWFATVGKATRTVRSWYEAYVVLNAKTVAPESSF